MLCILRKVLKEPMFCHQNNISVILIENSGFFKPKIEQYEGNLETTGE